MPKKIENRINDEYFILVCNSSKSMAQAASTLMIHVNSLRRRAKKLNCYKTNQSGKGINKKPSKIIPIDDIIIKNKYPEYQTFKLKKRLIKEGYKKNICEICNLGTIWNNSHIEMELDHIDGNRTNHLLNNLRIICPNCHSQTKTYRGKNATNNK
jgi:hypothetical protein